MYNNYNLHIVGDSRNSAFRTNFRFNGNWYSKYCGSTHVPAYFYVIVFFGVFVSINSSLGKLKKNMGNEVKMDAFT